MVAIFVMHAWGHFTTTYTRITRIHHTPSSLTHSSSQSSILPFIRLQTMKYINEQMLKPLHYMTQNSWKTCLCSQTRWDERETQSSMVSQAGYSLTQQLHLLLHPCFFSPLLSLCLQYLFVFFSVYLIRFFKLWVNYFALLYGSCLVGCPGSVLICCCLVWQGRGKHGGEGS